MDEKKSPEKSDTCWEFLSCERRDCPAYGQSRVPCWEVSGHRHGSQVFSRIEEKIIQCCFNCSYFKQLEKRARGRRWGDKTLLDTLEDALIRSAKYSKKVEDLYMEVIRRSRLMNLLGEVSKIIARLDKEEDIILAILTVITAKQGLGFNRAFVFLRGPEFDILRGKYALGPSSPEEAISIWKVLEKDDSASLEKLVNKGQKLHYLKNSPLTRITKRLSMPIDDPGGVIIKGVREIRFVTSDELESETEKHIASTLGLERFCICPIATKDDSLGFIIADNIFTGKEIDAEDAHLLELIASHATTSLRAAQLKESLNKNIDSLKSTYRKLKANEERMMKAERLAISGELTSSVIHEIKNPLVAIGGFARNLYHSGDVKGEVRDKLAIIMNEAMRLERYLENMQMKISKLKLELGEINQVLENNCQLLQNDFEERGITLLKSFTPDLPSCRIDVVKIHEVFLNILQNSFEAVEDGGEVRIRTWADSGTVYVEIKDTGKGIKEEHLSKVFTRFNKVDYTNDEKNIYSGTGIGLSLSKEIVQLLEGKIWLNSEPGRGSSFYFHIPRVRKDFLLN